MIRIFIIDDHPLFIDGVRSIFNRNAGGIELSGSANTAKEAIPKLEENEVDVVLIDLIMPEINGYDLLLMIKTKFPNLKTIALTASTDPELLSIVWENNADGILLKHCGKQQLINAIKRVFNGKRVIGKTVPYFPKTDNDDSNSAFLHMTKREKLVLNLLAKGNKRDDVAETLGISKNAIDFHCKNIFKKFNKNSLISVLEEAKKANIIRLYN
jgi:DNA-binding NarL/FixJ family response regulator